MSKKIKNVVCLGGGTGTSMVLSGLKKYPVNLSAIVTMFDGGAGSTGKLREELGVLPPGDIRQCLAALSEEGIDPELFNYRFEKGTFRGHSLGNLLLAAAEKLTGSFEKGTEKLRKMFGSSGSVIPVTLKNCNLKAVLNNSKRLENEDEIVNCKQLSKTGIKKIYLQPKAKAASKAISALKHADLIIIGPGKFYTSLIPNLLVEGIASAIRRSKAKKVFICNLMTQQGNTDNLNVEEFVRLLEEYLGKNVIDSVIFNTGAMSPALVRKVKKAFPGSDLVKYDKDLLKNGEARKFIGADILCRTIKKENGSDPFVKGANKRTMVLHDADKLARVIFKTYKTCKSSKR